MIEPLNFSFAAYSEENLVNNPSLQRSFLEHLLQTTNNSLEHYSLSAKGSKLYYQKIMLNKIYRARTRANDFVLDNSKYKTYRQANRYLTIGGAFQQAYYWMTVSNQIRRGVSPLIFGNDANTIGSFKNIAFNRGWNLGDSIVRRGQETRKTSNIRMTNWAILSNRVGQYGAYFYRKYHSVENTLPLKGKFGVNLFINLTTFRNSTKTLPFFEHMSLTMGSILHFIRTTWYNITLEKLLFYKPYDMKDNTGKSAKLAYMTETYHMLNSADIEYDQFLGTVNWVTDDFDLTGDLSVKSKLYRKKSKKHTVWRLGMAFWAKKIWQFKKSYRFWRYMRGMSNIMFRGFYGFSVFMNRLDVYAMRMFMLRNLRYVRVFIKAGHLFYGTYCARNPWMRVSRHGILSLSKEATMWTTRRGYKKFIDDDLFNVKNNAIVNLKNAALRFCRQHRDSAIWGNTQTHKFAMFFGEDIDVINMDSKRTNFFSLSYAYGQRAITSAWW